MAHRTHRHRVPTARPPAEAVGVAYLWGRGGIGADLRGYLHDEHAEVYEHDDVARKLALEHGCPLDLVRDAWAWRVEHVSPRILDLMTRDDPNVHGWTQFARETCPPSIALRNALNSLRKEELGAAGPEIARRFGKPDGAFPGVKAGDWVAADNRVVYFDEAAAQWRLGGYLAAQ